MLPYEFRVDREQVTWDVPIDHPSWIDICACSSFHNHDIMYVDAGEGSFLFNNWVFI